MSSTSGSQKQSEQYSCSNPCWKSTGYCKQHQQQAPEFRPNWKIRKDELLPILDEFQLYSNSGINLGGLVDEYLGKNFEGTSKKLTGHTGGVSSICDLGDGRFASGAWDNTVCIWDLNKETKTKPVQILKGHTEDVNSVCAWDNGRYLASCSDDETIRIWKIDEYKSEYKSVQTLKLASVYSIGVLKENVVVSGSKDGKVCIWKPSEETMGTNANEQKQYKLAQTLDGHDDWVTSVCDLGDGRFASGSLDSKICIWKLNNTGEYGRVQELTGRYNGVTSVCKLGNNQLASTDGNSIWIWKGEGEDKLYKHVKILNADTRGRGTHRGLCALSGDRLASGYSEKIYIWELNAEDDWEYKQTLEPPQRDTLAFVFSLCQLDDDRLVSGSYQDHLVRVWL